MVASRSWNRSTHRDTEILRPQFFTCHIWATLRHVLRHCSAPRAAAVQHPDEGPGGPAARCRHRPAGERLPAPASPAGGLAHRDPVRRCDPAARRRHHLEKPHWHRRALRHSRAPGPHGRRSTRAGRLARDPAPGQAQRVPPLRLRKRALRGGDRAHLWAGAPMVGSLDAARSAAAHRGGPRGPAPRAHLARLRRAVQRGLRAPRDEPRRRTPRARTVPRGATQPRVRGEVERRCLPRAAYRARMESRRARAGLSALREPIRARLARGARHLDHSADRVRAAHTSHSRLSAATSAGPALARPALAGGLARLRGRGALSRTVRTGVRHVGGIPHGHCRAPAGTPPARRRCTGSAFWSIPTGPWRQSLALTREALPLTIVFVSVSMESILLPFALMRMFTPFSMRVPVQSAFTAYTTTGVGREPMATGSQPARRGAGSPQEQSNLSSNLSEDLQKRRQ